MRILILGVDGYLGWSLAKHLGHVRPDWEVAGVDCYKRRDWVAEVGGQSATPIRKMTDRIEAYVDWFGKTLRFYRGDLVDYGFVEEVFRSFRPDAVVHLAEMPSAPYSMMGPRQACETHRNNLEGTLNVLFAMRDHSPNAQLLKLGTMGEYGTPNVDIPEGEFEMEFRGRKDKVMFPRRPGSLYHATKVHDTHNVHLACRVWGLRSTDVMQGVVYGLRVDDEDTWEEDLCTRFDFDGVFGTAINRFCAQVVAGEPITVFGAGHHSRGFLPLRDSMQCLTLALENPPAAGQYRTFNQFEQVYRIESLAEIVAGEARKLMLKPEVVRVENPRAGAEVTSSHWYNPDQDGLRNLGYVPSNDIEGEVHSLLVDLMRYRSRIMARANMLVPDVHWDGRRVPVKFDDGR